MSATSKKKESDEFRLSSDQKKQFKHVPCTLPSRSFCALSEIMNCSILERWAGAFITSNPPVGLNEKTIASQSSKFVTAGLCKNANLQLSYNSLRPFLLQRVTAVHKWIRTIKCDKNENFIALFNLFFLMISIFWVLHALTSKLSAVYTARDSWHVSLQFSIPFKFLWPGVEVGLQGLAFVTLPL